MADRDRTHGKTFTSAHHKFNDLAQNIMPTPKKPTNLLVLSGSVAHDPKRYANRTTEPKPTGVLGPAPKHFDAAHKLIWKEVIKSVPPGVLTNSDRIVVELTCRLTYKMRFGELTSSNAAQLVSCLSRLAMTPADRSRVNVTPGHGDPLVAASPFAKFVQAQ